MSALCAVMLTAYAAAVALPPMREFFDLAVPGVAGWLAAVATAAVMLAALAVADDHFLPRRP